MSEVDFQVLNPSLNRIQDQCEGFQNYLIEIDKQLVKCLGSPIYFGLTATRKKF